MTSGSPAAIPDRRSGLDHGAATLPDHQGEPQSDDVGFESFGRIATKGSCPTKETITKRAIWSEYMRVFKLSGLMLFCLAAFPLLVAQSGHLTSAEAKNHVGEKLLFAEKL